jgi:hypothetical protein
MTAFEKLRKASEEIIAICKQEQYTKEDKDQLLNIQQQILAAIEDLVECEGCNRIVTQIATITLDGESAKLCKDCGIKSLEAGKLVKKKTSQSRTQRSKKSQKKGHERSSDKPETPENTGKIESSALKTPAPETEKPVPKTEKSAPSPREIGNETPLDKQTIFLISRGEPPKENENPKPDLNELYGEVEAQTGINKRDVKKIHKLIEEIAYPMDLENTIIYTVAELEKARMRVERPAAEKAISMLFKR